MDLTRGDVEMILEALDSHLYWQVNEGDRRASGYVLEPYTEAEQEVVDLIDRIGAFLAKSKGDFALIPVKRV